MVLGLYYVLAAQAQLVPFFRFTVLGRSLQFVAFAGCVVAGWASPRLLLAAGFEAASGLWTAWELRRAARAP
jgi:hypothetical protein